MFKSNESSPITAGEIIPDQSWWYKGPDGKFYATAKDLRRAEEEWLEKKRYKLPQDEIIKKEKPPSLINPNEIQPPEILSPNLLQELTRIPADQLSALADFLASLPPPPTSSSEQK
jgi:hypothetical protein